MNLKVLTTQLRTTACMDFFSLSMNARATMSGWIRP
jgi:hypothetical protein